MREDHVLHSTSRPGWFIRLGFFGGIRWTNDLWEATRFAEWSSGGVDLRTMKRRVGGVAEPRLLDLRLRDIPDRP